MAPIRTASSILVVGCLWSSVPATAQPLGTYRWQLLPYCNVLTLNINQQGGIYTLDGTDDRCGAGQVASARGLAFLNPNGTIGFGVTMVQPGGVPVHLETTITLPLLNGTWRDSSGASGNIVQVSGAGFGGPPRLVAPSGVPPGSITAIQLANGAVGAAAMAANSVTTGHIVDGTITTIDLLDEPLVVASETQNVFPLISGMGLAVRQVTIQVPAPGRVIVNTSGWMRMANSTLDVAQCSITTLPAGHVERPFAAYANENSGNTYFVLPFGGTRTFTVPPGPFTVRLNCAGQGTDIVDPSLTAIFIAGS